MKAYSQSIERIYLLGMMGVGKSTLGRKAASLLSWPFIDLDAEVVARCRKTIDEIFATEGEDYFRQAEADALRAIAVKPVVVAVGGGTPCYHNNMKYMLDSGFTVYLAAPAPLIVQRVLQGAVRRPLLKGMDSGQVEDFISRTLHAREPFYLQAAQVLSVPGTTAETLVKSIFEPQS